MANIAPGRMQAEISQFEIDPPSGVAVWPLDDCWNKLEAEIQGPTETVYEDAVFKLTVDIPERYPFEPPKVRFNTPIYHPNIDDGGRICLSTLNLPPKGTWSCSLNVMTVLASIQQLLTEPNADDSLVPDIAEEFKNNREIFNAKAKQLAARARPGENSSPNKTVRQAQISAEDEQVETDASAHSCKFPQGSGATAKRPSDMPSLSQLNNEDCLPQPTARPLFSLKKPKLA